MEVFNVLDVIVRFIFIPFLWIFALSVTPWVKVDFKKWKKLYSKKQKTVQIYTSPNAVYSNSSYCKKVS